MSKNVKPSKTELAKFKALEELGYSPNVIGKLTQRDPKTIRKYLQSEVYTDPDIQVMVTKIKEKEINDLVLIGAKARSRLHELLDEGNTKVIETTAIMDRSFQQVRLLEGKSTHNLSHIHELHSRISAEIEEIKKEIKELDEQESKKE